MFLPANIYTCSSVISESVFYHFIDKMDVAYTSFNVNVSIWKETSTNMLTPFLRIWTICAFRVLNPHQLFLAKQRSFKRLCPTCAKTSWCQKAYLVNPQFTISINFKHESFWCSQNAKNQLKLTVELGYMCPRGLSGPPAIRFQKLMLSDIYTTKGTGSPILRRSEEGIV